MKNLKKNSIFVLFQVVFSLFCCFPALAQEQHTKVNETLIPVKNKNGKWGYLNTKTHTLVVSPQYDYAALFVNGKAMVVNRNQEAVSKRNAIRIGWIDTSGNEIFSPQFKNVDPIKTIADNILRDLRIVTTLKDEVGIISLTGETIVKPGLYKGFKFYNAEYFIVGENTFYAKGKIYKAPENTEIINVDIDKKLFYLKNKEGKKGLSTWKGKFLIDAHYNNLIYNEALKRFLASFKTTKAIDIAGATQEKTVYENHLFSAKGKLMTTFYAASPAKFIEDRLISFKAIDGKQPKKFVEPSHGKMLSAEKNTPVQGYYVFEKKEGAKVYYGLKNTKGNTVLAPKYAFLKLIRPDFIIAQAFGNGFHYGVINRKNETLIPFKYDRLHYLNGLPKDRLRAFKRESPKSVNGHYALMDERGKLLTDYLYDSFYFNKKGIALVKRDFKYGLIDASGTVLAPTEYDRILPEARLNTNREDATPTLAYFPVKKNGLWGMISSEGEMVMPVRYQDISVNAPGFTDGWVTFKDPKTHKSGLFNIHSKVEIAPSYSYLDIYKDCIIGMKKSKSGPYRYQLLSRDGEPITPLVYDLLKYKHGYLLAKKNGKKGVLNSSGEILVPFNYEGLKAKSPHLLLAYDSTGPLFYVSTKGEEIKIPE